ncbi:chemotaxis protein CheW [Virgibacillus flavescens]|uniref:chemotaxis protein CheW n=1 Tax=Virgibacillus flavescens TaxID=1611422 RepID=UPI003D331879
MDTNQYIEVFLDESREHLQAVNDNLLKLEKQPKDLKIVDEIFRSAHTLKGMSATMGFEDIASLTHQMENVLDQIRNSKLNVSAAVIDVTFEAIESLEEMVSDVSEGGKGKKNVSHIVKQLEQIENGTSVTVPAEKTEAAVSTIELDEYQNTVVSQAIEQGYQAFEVKVRLTEDCMLKAARVYMVFEIVKDLGEVIKTVPSIEELEDENFDQEFALILLSNDTPDAVRARIHKVSEIESVDVCDFSADKQPAVTQTEESEPAEQEQAKEKSKGTKGSKTIRVNSERIDELMNLFEEVVIDRGRLEDLAKKLKNHELTDTVEHMSRVSEDLQGLILNMRMVPVEQVFNRFPRMVRGLAKDLNKNINLEIIGADTELDRTVIDEIGDPLVHLIRNSIDHGIESQQVRKQSGKPDVGHLKLQAFHSGNHVFIEIEDDGAGINKEKVIAKAVENGLYTAEHAETLADQEVFQAIMASGFSTADEVTDLSGRGVGLDVVRSKIESLGGSIFIESEAGKGSKFSIQLPLTLSILATLLVKVQTEIYAVPLSSIVETVLLSKEEIMYAHGKKLMDFRGEVVPLLSLTDIFNVPIETDSTDKHHSIVVVKKGNRMTGLVVDSLIGQREIVLKSMGNYLQNIFAISGATILGDGQVSLIIDPNALIK